MCNYSLYFLVLGLLLKEDIKRFKREEPVHFQFLVIRTIADWGKSPFLASLPCDAATILTLHGFCYFVII